MEARFMKQFFSKDPAYQAFRILQLAFIIAPIVAGLDKFFFVMADWMNYLSPLAYKVLGENDQYFMMIIGAIEVIVGIGMIYRPRIFSNIVVIWLLVIVLNLLMTGKYFDIALRDFGLAIAAFALSRLCKKYA